MNRLSHLISRHLGIGLRSLLLILALLLPLAQTQAQVLKVMGNYPGYVALGPPLIINLATDDTPKFLRAEIDLYVLNAEDNSVIQEHNIALRDQLITLYGGRDMEVLQTAEGREALRKETLEALREVLNGYAENPAIEDLYFTAFVMQ